MSKKTITAEEFITKWDFAFWNVTEDIPDEKQEREFRRDVAKLLAAAFAEGYRSGLMKDNAKSR